MAKVALARSGSIIKRGGCKDPEGNAFKEKIRSLVGIDINPEASVDHILRALSIQHEIGIPFAMSDENSFHTAAHQAIAPEHYRTNNSDEIDVSGEYHTQGCINK